MIKHPKRKNLFYYLKRLLVLGVLIGLSMYTLNLWNFNGQIDAEKILDESLLKNKTFNAEVKKIESGLLSAYFMEEHSNPIVSVSFTFTNAGSAHDEKGKYGLALTAASLLTDGAGDFSESEFNEVAEENGVKLGFSVSADNFSGEIAFPSQNKDIAVQLLQAALTAPRVEDKYLNNFKNKMRNARLKQQENPSLLLQKKFAENIFAGHPYSRNRLGKEQDMENLKREDVLEFVKNYLAQDNLKVGIVGDISENEAKKLLNELFGGLTEKSLGTPLPKINFSADGVEYNTKRKSAQVLTSLAAKGTSRNSDDFYPLYLANYILGGNGLSSRLSKVIREKEGLTYGVYTYLSDREAVALIGGGFSATPENFGKAQQLLKEEWLKMGQNGVTETELNDAKKSLINSFYLRFAAINNISEMLVAMQKYNLGLDFLVKRNDYIRQVSLEEVNEAAKKYFSTIPDFVNVGMDN